MRNPTGAIAALSLLILISGCGYVWTFDEAFPPEPVNFPRWDPPDSVAQAAWVTPEPPQVEAVILDSYFYYLIHPPGEEDTLAARAAKARPRPKPPVHAAAPDTAVAVAAADTVAVEATRTDTIAAAPQPLPPVQVDLSHREEDVLNRRARVDMERAESILVVLEGRRDLSGSARDQISLVRSYLGQTRAALERRDFQGAANLALKARILAESLDESKP